MVKVAYRGSSAVNLLRSSYFSGLVRPLSNFDAWIPAAYSVRLVVLLSTKDDLEVEVPTR